MCLQVHVNSPFPTRQQAKIDTSPCQQSLDITNFTQPRSANYFITLDSWQHVCCLSPMVILLKQCILMFIAWAHVLPVTSSLAPFFFFLTQKYFLELILSLIMWMGLTCNEPKHCFNYFRCNQANWGSLTECFISTGRVLEA